MDKSKYPKYNQMFLQTRWISIDNHKTCNNFPIIALYKIKTNFIETTMKIMPIHMLFKITKLMKIINKIYNHNKIDKICEQFF